MRSDGGKKKCYFFKGEVVNKPKEIALFFFFVCSVRLDNACLHSSFMFLEYGIISLISSKQSNKFKSISDPLINMSDHLP